MSWTPPSHLKRPPKSKSTPPPNFYICRFQNFRVLDLFWSIFKYFISGTLYCTSGGLGSRGTADNNYNDEDLDEDGDNGHDGDDMKNIAMMMMMMMMGWPTSAGCRWQNSESDDES